MTKNIHALIQFCIIFIFLTTISPKLKLRQSFASATAVNYGSGISNAVATNNGSRIPVIAYSHSVNSLCRAIEDNTRPYVRCVSIKPLTYKRIP